MCFSDWSFAVDDNTGTLWTVTRLLNFIISVLSWIWVIFAKLAWEFLTNKWIYWEWLWIDALLWQYRNIVKNIANFCLWFYLLYVIFNGLIWQFKWKEKIVENLKGVLLRVLVAWIWIQASWFLTWLIIDLSTVTLSAVWAFPSQIISQNKTVEGSIDANMRQYFDDEGMKKVSFWKIYELFPKTEWANSFTKMVKFPLDGDLTREKLFDSLMPNKEDVAGPLYYLWFSILEVNKINSISSWDNNQSLKKSILNLIIQWWTTIVYSIEIAILCVIALMRILYLWMFIVLSPLAILFACIGKTKEKGLLEKWFMPDLMKQINLKTFISKAFQPAIIVLWISLATIFVSLIGGVVNKDPTTKSMKDFDVWKVKITTIEEGGRSSTSEDKTYTTKLEWNLLEFSASSLWKWFLELIMCIITVLLVYFIIKTSITIWNWQDTLSKKIDNLVKWVEWVMTSVPVVPVAWYDKDGVPTENSMSIGQIFGVWDKKWQSLISEKINRVQWKIKDKYNEQNAIIDSLIGNDTWYLDYSAQRNIQKRIEETTIEPKWWDRLRNTLQEIKVIRDEKWKWMTLNGLSESSRFWIQEFEKRLTKMGDESPIYGSGDDKAWNDMIKWWKDNKDNNRSLQNMFDKLWAPALSAYAKFFELSWNISTWNDLMNKDISSKKDTK